MIATVSPTSPPTLVYAARFYDPRPKIVTYQHLYSWRVGQKGRGKQLTTGAFDDEQPRCSSNGKTVFFFRQARSKAEPKRLCAVDLASRRVRVLFTTPPPSGKSRQSDLYDLRLSPSGNYLLFRQTAYFDKPGEYFFPEVQRIFGVALKGNSPSVRPVWNGKTDEEVSADWAANDTVLLLHPPVYHEGHETTSGTMDAISLATPKAAPRRLPVQSGDYSLEQDVSPDGKWILNQADETGGGSSLVQIVDGKVVKIPTLAREELYWLNNRRLVGVEKNSDYVPLRFRVFDFDTRTTQNTPILAPFIELHLHDPAIQTALDDDGWEMSNLSPVESVPGRTDGFLLGTFAHREQTGVRVWIDLKTGQARLWAKSGKTHPSPDGTHFWMRAGYDYRVIGKHPNGTDMTETVQDLFVTSYAAPDLLIRLVNGSAYSGGADWLPAPTPVRKSGTTKAAKDKNN